VLKILIIDDDRAGTQLLSTLLDFEGHRPLALQNWDEPVGDVERLRPDLVIMDVYMRATNGLDILGQIRKQPDPEIANVPILMMSAEDQEQRSLQAGADGFLEKPFQIETLVSTIREIMEDRLSENLAEQAPERE
jgi:two-component system alkaline phosphatase synthesis response regulator PhoP